MMPDDVQMMIANKSLSRALTWGLSCSTLLALIGLSSVTATAQSKNAGYEVKLNSKAEIVSATDAVVLVLSLHVQRDCKVPMALFNGLKLKTTVNGKPGPRLRQAASGSVKMTKDTRLSRLLTIDMKRVVPGQSKLAVARVTFEWEGAKGASTFVQVAPDLKGVSVDTLDLAKTQVVIFTSHGDMALKFFPDKAPGTVENFVTLAKNGFYDTTAFHRVIPGFMIQGGCPNSKPGADGVPGTGSPGYKIKAEFNDTRHVRGVISMAREGGNPDSAGCQFFIVHAPSGHLDGQYTAFGELVSGHQTLDKIAAVQLNGSAPVEPVRIKKMVVKPVFKQ